MRARFVRRACLQVEALESRWAPATRISPTQFIYQDIDGDPVRVTFSKPILTSDAVANSIFRLRADVGSPGNAQLVKIDLTTATGAKRTDIIVQLDGSPTGDGQVHVGFINAEGVDLGRVKVAGDLGRISAGDDKLTTPALKALRTESIGVKGVTTQETGGTLNSRLEGPVGKIETAGDIQDAQIHVVSDKGNLGLLHIGGSLVGGTVPLSGRVATFGSLGAARIDGNILGGAGSLAGQVFVTDQLGDITIGGSVTGGTGGDSGKLYAGTINGAVRIDGNVLGRAGIGSGSITSDGDIRAIKVTGGLIGGTGASSGRIDAEGSIGAVSIAGSVASPATGGSDSGGINGDRIKRVVIGGDLEGAGVGKGEIFAYHGLGSVTIRGSLIGDSSTRSGWVQSGGNIGDVTITGSVFGGSLVAAGSLGNVTVGESIFGSSNARVLIAAGGDLDKPARIASLTVGGSVSYADILAGYSSTLSDGTWRSNGDARIGSVKVGGDWVTSSLVAGVDSGTDGLFGTADDGAVATGSSEFISKIGRITIDGVVYGTASAGDSFGIVAELIKALSIFGNNATLTPGALNDIGEPLPTDTNTNDCVLTELEA